MSIAEAFRTNAALTQEFVESLDAEALAARYTPRTRTVAAQFAHIHNVRVANLEQRGKQKPTGALEKFPRGAEPSGAQLKRSLAASAKALAKLFDQVEETGVVPGWSKRPPETWLAYHVAHEAHHRALAIVCLRAAGIDRSEFIKWGLWSGWRKPPA